MTDYTPWTGARLDSLAGKVDLLAEETVHCDRLIDRVSQRVDDLAEREAKSHEFVVALTADYARLYQRVADVAAALDTAVTTLTTRQDDDAQSLGQRVAALEESSSTEDDEEDAKAATEWGPDWAESVAHLAAKHRPVTCGDITRSFHAEGAHRHAVLLREVAAHGVAPHGADGHEASLYRAGILRAADLIDEWAAP